MEEKKNKLREKWENFRNFCKENAVVLSLGIFAGLVYSTSKSYNAYLERESVIELETMRKSVELAFLEADQKDKVVNEVVRVVSTLANK